MNKRYAFTLATAVAMYCGYAGAELNDPDEKDSRVQQGFAIAPVPLNLKGKNRGLVGLGSYIINSAGCNDCHTWGPPPGSTWAPGGNPFLGQPAQLNTAYYLSGGRFFGPVVSKNLTPDANGLPAGLTLDEFVFEMRTGRDVDNPNRILQAMPWPLIGQHTDRDLHAMYEYLRAIPSLPNNY